MTSASPRDLYRLMAWLSPAFPVGAFSYSHGLEWAVESGRVTDRAGLETWIGGILGFGAGRLDATLFRAAHGLEGFEDLIERADAWRGSAELAHESAQQGQAFLAAVEASWPEPGLATLRAAAKGRPIAYPVAVGAAAGFAGIPLEPALAAFLQAFAANLVSAGVRLVPLGQTDGQIAVRNLEGPVAAAVAAALARPLHRLGGAASLVDLASMNHETQYTRLFRT